MPKYADISDNDIRTALRRPDSFGYVGSNEELFTTWSLGPVVLTRDSNLLDRSNYKALVTHLGTLPHLDADWDMIEASHWGVGWVKHLSFRAVEKDGEPTEIFKEIQTWFAALSEYPVADDADFSEREHEATLQNIEDVGRQLVSDKAEGSDWVVEAYRWFDEHNQGAVESRDCNGGYPSDAEMKECLEALGYLRE